MPSLSAVRQANADALSSLSSPPVAVFVGGTSGIGQGTAEAFARHTKGNAHIIICGRNRQAAERIIANFPPAPPGVKHEFVECDATLMRNVRSATSDLLARLPKLNYLVLTPGILTMQGRTETEEGIDRKLALHYYARWKFAYDLAGLMQKTKDSGEDAKALTVLAPGRGGQLDLDDLGLKKRYTLGNAANFAITSNDLMIESFAARHPNMTFTHSDPGVVRTSIVKQAHWALKPLNPILTGLVYPFSRSQEDSGEHMLHALLAGDRGSFRRNETGDDIGKKAYFCTDEARTALWEHTMQATGTSE